jgi:hypothetical protein
MFYCHIVSHLAHRRHFSLCFSWDTSCDLQTFVRCCGHFQLLKRFAGVSLPHWHPFHHSIGVAKDHIITPLESADMQAMRGTSKPHGLIYRTIFSNSCF